jgi:hypothetical protein
MSAPCKFERSLRSREEYETVHVTHHAATHGSAVMDGTR